MSPTTAKPRAYRPPVSKDGKPLPPLHADTIIVRKDDAVPIELLNEFHKNPNKGDVNLIRESIAENGGLFRSVVVNVGTLTARPYEILAGNHTVKSADAEGKRHVPVDWVDVDDVRAVKIMSVDNAAARKAKIDTDILAELLVPLESLVGTGITDDELAKMLGEGDDPDTGPQLPEASFAVIIDCEDETQQAELLATFMEEGLSARPLMM